VILAPFHGSYCATNDHQDVSTSFEAEVNQAPPISWHRFVGNRKELGTLTRLRRG
jgi:hypothetical protein